MSPLDSGHAPDAGTIAVTYGASHTARAWPDRRTMTWPDLAAMLTTHAPGSKEGPCFVPALFRGDRRHKADAEQIDLAVLDADAGHTLEEIEGAIRSRGWAAIVSSTHSHLTTTTTVKKTHWQKFVDECPIDAERAFLIEEKNYLPRVAEGANISHEDAQTLTFAHAPCPKFRVIVRLDRPWLASDYANQTAANAAWKERIEALANALSLSHDQSCTDTSRLFYLPRTPDDGRKPETAIIAGTACPIWTLPSPTPAEPKNSLFDGTHETADFIDPETGEIIDLRTWVRTHAGRFEIVTALRSRTPGVFVGFVADGGHHHVRCVNEDAHTSSAADRATFVVNASEADNRGFVYHCRHAHCTGQDRLFFVRKMLNRRWLTIADLTAAEFQTASSAPDDTDWPAPLDFLADADMTGAPELRPEHIPAAIAPFVFDTAARMGVDPAAVALAALVSLSSVMPDTWAIQPKRNDDTWTENPRMWGAIVGDPSMLKTPILKATTAPIDKLEAEARNRHKDEIRAYRSKLKAWKDAGGDPADEPTAPRVERRMVEGTTTEAISEVLRDDEKATQHAPAGKILIRQDEMSEWVASFDRYKSGGKGGADRGAYLRLYNGGRYTIDRVNRGAFAITNWSACILGGIQPGPIRQIAKDAADDGLLQRFCYAVPARQTRGLDRLPDAAAITRYGALFPALARMHPSQDHTGATARVVLHADAHRHRLAMLDLTEALAAMPDTSDRLKSAFGKWPGLWARMVLVFHLIDLADARIHDSQANVANVANASAVMATTYLRDILLPHLLRADAVMFATEQTSHARWIAGFILSKSSERIAARDIMRAYGSLRAPEKRKELLDVMASLETMGWVRAEPAPDGRPTVAWLVNPAVHSVFVERAKRERAEREATREHIRETLAKHRSLGGMRDVANVACACTSK